MAEPQINTGTQPADVASGIYGDAWKSAEKFDKQTDEGIKKMESEKIPGPPELKEAPNPKDFQTDSMQTFGSAAMFLSAFGSLLTKQPLESALNSGAAVMNAVNSKDANAFKQAMDKYKIDTDNAYKLADYNQQLYKDVLGKDEAELKARAVSAKDNVMIHMADAKMATKLYEDRQKNVDKLEKHQLITDAADADRQAALDSGKSEQEANKIYMESFGKYSATMSGKLVKNDDTIGVHWDELKPEDPVPGTGLTFSSVKQKAEGLHNGSSYPNVGLSMRTTKNPQKDAVDAYLSHKYPDFDIEKAQLAHGERMREESAIAGRSAPAKVAVKEMDKLADPMVDAVKKIDPSKYPDLNALMNAYAKKTGGADVIKAGQAVQEFRTAFVNLMIRNGVSTDAARARGDEIVDLNMSLDQIEGVRDQAKITSAAVIDALNEAKNDITGTKSQLGLAGKPPDDKHVKMLTDDPSDENKKYFDEAFGEGAAAKALGQ